MYEAHGRPETYADAAGVIPLPVPVEPALPAPLELGGHLVVDLRQEDHVVIEFPLERRLRAAPRAIDLALKRAMDFVGSLIGLLLLAPLLLVVAVAIKLTSPGPIFFLQERCGWNGRRFRMVKFRSMHPDADLRRVEVQDLNEKDGPIFKIRNDPRVTPLGRLLRRFSIDELPNLFNVLAGHMSLVGPRPPLPSEVAEYGDRELRRLDVKPGITCTWQVSGRSDLDFNTWVDMDLEYIERWSLGLDVRLLAKTIPAVLTGKGAY